MKRRCQCRQHQCSNLRLHSPDLVLAAWPIIVSRQYVYEVKFNKDVVSHDYNWQFLIPVRYYCYNILSTIVDLFLTVLVTSVVWCGTMRLWCCPMSPVAVIRPTPRIPHIADTRKTPFLSTCTAVVLFCVIRKVICRASFSMAESTRPTDTQARRLGNRTTRRQTNSRSVKLQNGQLGD